MDAGRCLRCGRPFTSGEITGVGILRPRRAAFGGPYVEFDCPACKLRHKLVPHGNGRYAPPGSPPPPAPTDDERRVPWRRGEPRADAADAADAADVEDAPRRARAPAEPRRPAPERAERAEPAGRAPPRVHVEDEEAWESPSGSALPKDVAAALSVLELTAGASAKDIDRAFRRLALTCHPDKVAHLDSDFVALAERKFKRLQAARDLLLGT